MARNIHHMIEHEIDALIFEGASVSELRSPTDGLTESEILDLPNHPAWDQFSSGFHSFIWASIDSIVFNGEK